VIGDPELVREVLSTKFGDFKKSKLAGLSRLLFGGVGILDGEEWTKRRRIMNPAFHAEKLKVLAKLKLKRGMIALLIHDVYFDS
jgi:cytochrome P450